MAEEDSDVVAVAAVMTATTRILIDAIKGVQQGNNHEEEEEKDEVVVVIVVVALVLHLRPCHCRDKNRDKSNFTDP